MRIKNRRTKRVIEILETRIMLSTYYVSPTGSDANAGTSAAAPWATLAKVDATAFHPGDQILFQTGGEWHGQLTASASGTAANPIVYSDYGNTSLPTPIIDGSDVIPDSAFTLVSGSTYSLPISSVTGADGNAYWVYANHVGLEAAGAGDNSTSGVLANPGSFYINGTTVEVNTGGQVPSSGSVVYTLGDRGAGTNANSSLINSNGYSYITFENLEGRETAEVGSNNALTGGIPDGYIYRIQGGSNVSLINDDGEYGSKHIVGAIDTTAFLANGLTCEGAPEGVSGNGLPYGNATATVAYSDNDTGDTSQWINVTVSNYDSGQPAFLTHGNPNAIASILLQNFVSLGSPIALEPATGVAITINGGEITNNTLTAYSGTNVTEVINGMTLTGAGSAIEVYGNATVENCLLEGSSQSNQAIQVNGANNFIRFNTIDPPSYAAAIALEGNSTGTAIYGNLITGTANAISIGSSTTYSADYEFFDSTAGSPNFGGQSLSQFKAEGYETHSVYGNPEFTNAATGDFSLQSSSPAINVVPTSFVTPALTSDIRGYARPSANVYDDGAYEFQSQLHQPTIANTAAANPNPVTGTTTALSVLGASPDGEATLAYTWSTTGTPPAPVTFSANGTNAAKNTTATFTKAGTYNFSVNVSNGTYSTISSVAVVVNQTPSGVTLTPSTMFVSINTTQQYTGIVADQFGNQVVGSSVVYSIQSGGGTISSTGLFTAPGTTGTTIIKATAGSSSATATATITPPNQAPTVATAASASPNPVTSTTTHLSVLGADDNGEANLTYTWSLIGTPPAPVTFSINGTNAAKNTVATFSANGAYNFLVTITDSGGLSTTSSTTVNVNIFVPIVVDGTLDGRYGSPLAVQTQATDLGYNSLQTNPTAPYSQLSALYGIIDQTSGQLDLFLAGSLDLLNAHLDLFIDSIPGEGAVNTSALANAGGPWNSSGNDGFSSITFDNGFRPDHLFTATYDGGYSLDYYNFDTNTHVAETITDPATGLATSSGGVPYFTERVNNAEDNTIVAANTGGSVTTGAEFAFNLSGLGYTTADFNAGDPIGIMAMLSYGSHTESSNQMLPPNSTVGYGSYLYYGSNFDFNNNTTFPGNQYVDVSPPAAPAGPTVATTAGATPNPVTSGTTTDLSVLGADSAGESTLRYTWSTTGTPPAPVSFSANSTNSAKNTIATFTANGTYNFLVTITDISNLTATSTVTVTVSGIGSTANPGPTVTAPAAANPNMVTGTTTALSVLASDPAGAATLTYNWSSVSVPANAPPVTFSVNGTNAAQSTTAHFYQAGTYTLTATITDASGYSATSSVVVTVQQTVTTLYVLPPKVGMAFGTTQQYILSATDQYANTIFSPAVAWSVGGGGTISSSGLFTAGQSAGTFTIAAVSGGMTAQTTVTVAATGSAAVESLPTVQSVSYQLQDVGTGGLIISNGGIAGLSIASSEISQGADSGAGDWNGATGITSSAAAHDSTYLTAVGVMLNNNGNTLNPAAIYSVFDGIATSLNDVLIRYTCYGDANLDGKVDGSDYSRVDNGFLNHLIGWSNGDFNYDGVINGSDYTLIDNAFNRQGPAMPAAMVASTAKQSTASSLTATSSVPLAPATGSVFSQSSIASVAAQIFAVPSDGSIFTRKLDVPAACFR
jgi:hypothetical protein